MSTRRGGSPVGYLVLAAVLAFSLYQSSRRADRPEQAGTPARASESAPYQAEVEEGLGAAVAILVDTSGSMKEDPPGESRPRATSRKSWLKSISTPVTHGLLGSETMTS